MRLRVVVAIGIVALVLNSAWAGGDGKTIIVKLKQGGSIRSVNKNNGTETVAQIPNTSIYLVRAAGDSSKTLRQLRRDSTVEAVEINHQFRLTSGLVQGAVSFLDGQTLTSFNGAAVLKSYAEQPAVRVIRADGVRQFSTGAGTRVGFMDTGADFHHPALRPWLEEGVNLTSTRTASELDGLSQGMVSFLDQGGISFLDPAQVSFLDGATSLKYLGHGTLVAGLIHLVAPDARLVPIKAFNASGDTTLFTIIGGVYWAMDHDLDVLNLSFSIDEDSEILHKAIDQARAAGTVVVAAAGNDGRERRDVYPAGWGNVHGVAATDLNDRLASFSNYGKCVTVTAPGTGLVSTFPGGKYAVVWGTSFSTPLVSGAVALIASSRGFGQSDAAAVVTTADPIDGLNPGFERKLGKGRINVQQALKSRK